MKTLASIWKNEDGFVISTELVLVATLLVMGLVVGMQSVRDSALAELADIAAAVGNLNQSFSYAGVRGHASYVAGSLWIDQSDFCDMYLFQNQGQFSQCVGLVPPTFEGVGAPAGIAAYPGNGPSAPQSVKVIEFGKTTP
jgi:hypothetical protein